MQQKYLRIMIPLLLAFSVSACSKNTHPPIELHSTTIGDAYPGNLVNVDKIELVDGSTGSRETIEQKHEIDGFLNELKDIVLEPDENQEGRVGYRFRIILYENDDVQLDFTPQAIKGIYYEPNEKFDERIRKLFEKYFEKEF